MDISCRGKPIEVGWGTQVIKVLPGIGPQGHTPQRGKDYWTDADKAELVSMLADALGLRVADGALCQVIEMEG